jgi:hypothetical protein
MSDTGLLTPALEKGVYSTFRQAQVCYRQGQIGTKLIEFDSLQLPTNSVLHICDEYLKDPIDTILPNLDNPFIKNEQYKRYLDFVLTLPTKDDPLFPITDKFRFRPYQFNSDIRKFFTAHHEIYKVTSRESTLHQANALPIFNYNVALTAVVTGTFVYYRKFDILLRTILSNITSIEGKHQYLQIELSKTLYRKVQFQQTFDKINYQTVRIKNDQSFYFLIHLINFLSKHATTSLFSKLTQVQLDQLNVILTAGNKAIIYNLGDLKAILDARNDDLLYQMVLRHISTLKLAGYADLDITKLDDKDYDKLVEDSAPKDDDHSEQPAKPTDPDSAATHNITSPDENIPQNQDNNTRPAASQKELVHGATPTNVLPEQQLTKHQQTATIEIPQGTKSEAQTPLVIAYDPNKATSVIDHAAHALIMNDASLTDAQKERLLKVAQAYKTLHIDGRSIEEL